MFVAMAVVGLTTLTLLLTNPRMLTSMSSSNLQSSSNPNPHICTDQDKHNVWSQLPECKPRRTLVSIPFPQDPNVLNVIPHQIEVDRCDGTCHLSGGQYQKCVADSKMNTSVQVMYEKIVMSQTEGSQLVEECNTVEMEVHTSCRCGCQQTKCNELQMFEDRTCECKCKDIGARGQCLVQYNKMWDPLSCQCMCRPEEWKECSTGYKYDGIYSCQCQPDTTLASPSVLVVMSVLIVALLAISVLLYTMFYKTKRELRETIIDRNRERLFPQNSYI